jgi:hypothetical protein
MKTLNRFLFTQIDNAPLIIFRIFFGFLIACECYGAMLTGWVKRTLIEPQFTFNFIGFDWLQPLPGNGMYIYFLIMGTLGLFIMIGYRYRFSIVSFTILWTGVYLMQKTSYNNHYYLLILISGMMCFFPAERAYSIDSRKNPSIKRNSMLSYVKWLVIIQLSIVYTYASIAKVYADWLDFGIIRILMFDKAHYYLIGDLLQQEWVHKIIGAMGIAFDLLVVPALLWKPSRKTAFCVSIFFHLFNSIVFQIGIFPYLSLAFIVFFFEGETIRKIFFKRKEKIKANSISIPSFKNSVIISATVYIAIQILLPLRHHFIKDDVLWTEEGHRMSWRMMLRARSGYIQFKVVDQKNNKVFIVKPETFLSTKQNRRIAAYPDFIWQFAQRLKKDYILNGQNVSVYAVNSKVSINGKPLRAFIDPNVDLANEPWSHFKHHEWILPSEEVKNKTEK